MDSMWGRQGTASCVVVLLKGLDGILNTPCWNGFRTGTKGGVAGGGAPVFLSLSVLMEQPFLGLVFVFLRPPGAGSRWQEVTCSLIK